MKIAFICLTPYHLIGSLSIIFYTRTKCKTDIDADIYLHQTDFFEGNLIRNLYQTRLFHHIYYFSDPDGNIIEKFFNRIFIYKSIIENSTVNEIEQLNYDYIALAHLYSLFAKLLVCVNKKAELIYFDDGTGSYFNFISTKMGLKDRFTFIVHLNARKDWMPQKYIHFYTLDRFQLETNSLVIDLCSNNELQELILSAFNNESSDLYKKRPIVYCTQPDENNGYFTREKEKKILSILKENRNLVVLRIHPRDKYRYSGFECEKDSIWELNCMNQITENNILIGFFSTAQFSPKLLFNKEPMVIFTYHYYGLFDSKLDAFVQILKDSYSDKEKVVDAFSSDEIKAALSYMEDEYEI